MAFGCGHPDEPANWTKNGAACRPRCRTCEHARKAARRAAEPGRVREVGRAATRKYRGGLKGHGNSQKTRCPEGHEYTPENTYLFDGARQCKQCRRATCVTYHQNKRANSGSHTHAEWLALCAEYGHRCLRCGGEKPLTRDHVVPVARGGGNEISNIQPLCRSCNSAKGLSTTDYRRQPVAV